MAPSPVRRSGPTPAVEASFQEVPKTFGEIYDEHVDFVWKRMRRLGVQPASIADAVQDVFIVVHRRLGEIEPGRELRRWILAILVRVAQRHRRTYRRKQLPLDRDAAAEALPDTGVDPASRAEQRDVVRLIYRILDELEPPKREVFVLAELEQMTAPEMAEVLRIPMNTVYSRLRAARADFERALAREKAIANRSEP